MDNEEIEKIFSKEPRFKGVFAIDEISELILKKDQGLIVNTSERDIRHGHWVTIYRDVDGKVYYIDSLNIKNLMNHLYFVRFFKNNDVKYVRVLCNPVQPLSSQACGAYDIYYLSHLFNGVSFSSIMSKFDTKNLEMNDITALTYVYNVI